MNDHRLAHLAYVLLTVCCPRPGEMRCDSFEGGFSSSNFRPFFLVDFPHFANIFRLYVTFDSATRDNIQFTTSSRRLDGGAYCGAPVGGKCMVSKAKLVLYAFAV